MKLELIPAYDRIPELSELIREYTDAILAQGDDVRKCLAVQHLDEELIRLYETYGFYRIGKYNDNPAETAVFMQLDL